MARLYVYAFTDTAVKPWNNGGRAIESVTIDGIVVVCERRASLPPVTEKELRRQHSIVVRIADRAEAVLPARFGSILEEPQVREIVRGRSGVIRRALERVRGNVQMTIRFPVRTPRMARAERPASGRAYLQERRMRASPPLAPRVRAALGSVTGFVKNEERRVSADDGVMIVYHLVSRTDVRRYMDAILESSIVGMRVTGPWPPFAFVPDLWRDEEDT